MITYKIKRITISKKLRELREAARLNQTQLARLIGCSSVYINRVENGDQEISLEFAFRVEYALADKSHTLSDMVIRKERRLAVAKTKVRSQVGKPGHNSRASDSVIQIT